MYDSGGSFAVRYGSYALVTGASEGIGRAFAVELAQKGLDLILVARREAVLKQLAEEIQTHHGVQCQVLSADLAQQEEVERVMAFSARFDVGLVVCSAGFGTAGNFLDNDLSNEMSMLSVNCEALTRMTHAYGAKFKERGRGAIILLSSIIATQGVPRSAHYSATKAYVQALGEALYEEWRGSGVDLLIVAPGPVETGFSKRSKMQFGLTTTPDVVAIDSINALGRQRLVHPGWLAKVMSLGLSITPRSIRVKVMGMVMKEMTKRLPS